MTINVDMFFHKEDEVEVEVKNLDFQDCHTLDIRNGGELITLFFFDERGLIDFKNQVVQQYEMLKRKGDDISNRKSRPIGRM